MKQKIFFVSTAPLSADGHVNCSPKGLDTFRVLNENTVVYQDLTGSGVETIAHVKENKRITIMFCAFEGPPKILRLYGTGQVITTDHDEYITLDKLFTQRIGTRAYIKINVARIADSCGYSVPHMIYSSNRDVLDKWCNAKGTEGLIEYRKQKNKVSIDGLLAIDNLK